MSFLMQKLLGRLYMNEAPAEGGDGGGGLAPAAADAPAPAPAPAVEAPSLLGDLAKPAPEAAPDKPVEEATKPDAPALPEVYEFKMPEGVELDEAAAPLVQELFKELGLPQDKAQAVFDKLLAIDQARQPSAEQAEQQQVEAIGALNKSWADECAKLPDIGGDNFNKSLETTSKVMVKFATPELRQMLNHSALGSNPEFFKFIHSIGSAMSQDTLEHGGNAANGPRSIEERLWPKK
jgi:pyruvate/2-oxoglutarate dehydrogenase complex dihydrolipoamide acyltransferase (E2) component